MANVYLSSSGSATAPYDTWAKAATDWATAIAQMSAGDSLYVENTFNEVFASGSQSFAFPGTITNPCYIYSSTTGDVYTPATSSMITLGGSGDDFTINTTVTGGSFFMYGCNFHSNDNFTFSGNGRYVFFKDCDFLCEDRFNVGSDDSTTFFESCIFDSTGGEASADFSRSGRGTSCFFRDCQWVDYGTLTSGAALFDSMGGDGTYTEWDGCTFEGLDTYVFGQLSTLTLAKLNYCDIPSTADQDLRLTTSDTGWNRVEYTYCGDDDAVASVSANNFGYQQFSSTKYRTGGAADIGVPYGWEITTRARTASVPWISKEVYRFVQPGSQTLSFYVALDTLETLDDSEFWVELLSPPEESSAAGKFSTTQVLPMATAATLTADSDSTWNGSDVETAYKIEMTINPRVSGLVKAKFFLKKNTTAPVVIDPIIEVSY